MKKEDFKATRVAGIILFLISAFMVGVFFLSGGAHGPAAFKVVFLGMAIGIPAYIFLKVFLGELHDAQRDLRGEKRSAVLEAVGPDPKRTGHLLLTLRYDGTGESFTYGTNVQIDQSSLGKRLWVIVDSENEKNREVLLNTLGEAAPPAPERGDDGEYGGPLNDAMLEQARDEAAAGRETADAPATRPRSGEKAKGKEK